MKKHSWFKRIAWILVVVLVCMNAIAALHAWKFTHFSDDGSGKTTASDNAMWLAITGVENPRPANTSVPIRTYETINIDGDIPTECWFMQADSSIGTVLVCHGYGGTKSSMLDKAEEFLAMNYSVLLLDFMGCGGSDGNQCTIGFLESQQVKSCYDYLVEQGENHIVFFGTSMGAVAIMKSLSEDSLDIAAAILECPFGSMYETTCARFRMMDMPSFPMAGLLVFWGGIENGFWAFDHEPVEYAKSINCPVLLMYGEKDPKVSRSEIDNIYTNLQNSKKLVTFAEAGHENYLRQYAMEWRAEVSDFLHSK
jgi:uncharacterized protein